MANSKAVPQRPKGKRTAPKRKPRPAAKPVNKDHEAAVKRSAARKNPDHGLIPSDNPNQGRTY